MTGCTGREAHEGQMEVREDEEQRTKLEQCLELLVAAGYFRARIQGLPPFDKLVGGMAWCIESCCIDLDVDLLYHDNLTIGQKISLTERLVSVLPVLQCPYLLQPHQVQGLDAAHILPVMQWLVREALAKRAEYGSVSRAVAALHYAPYQPTPPHHAQHILHDLTTIQCGYEFVRRWSVAGGRQGGAGLAPQQRVHTTLLEYSTDHVPLANVARKAKDLQAHEEIGNTQENSAEATERQQLLRSMQQAPQHSSDHASSDARLNAMLKSAAASTPLQPHAAASLATKNTASLSEQNEALEAQLSALQLQSQQQENTLQQLQLNLQQAAHALSDTKGQLQHLKADNQHGGGVEEMKKLVEEAERIKKSEHQYKDECRQHAAKLQQNIRLLEDEMKTGSIGASPELLLLVQQERSKWAKTRDAAATAARQLALLRRAWDDVPGNAELAQYRHRLTELNDMVMSSERETQQFYTMYNTLLDSKTAMEKHLTLLNDILDNIPPSMKSVKSSTQLLAQVDAVLGGIQQNKTKACNEREHQEAEHREVTAKLSALQDTARLYTRTAHALAHQLNRNQQLTELSH